MSLVTVKRTSDTIPSQPTSSQTTKTESATNNATAQKPKPLTSIKSLNNQSLDTSNAKHVSSTSSSSSSLIKSRQQAISNSNDKQQQHVGSSSLSSQRSYESTKGMLTTSSTHHFRRSLNATTMQLDQHKALLTLNYSSSDDTKTSEKYFVVKDAAMLLPRVSSNGSNNNNSNNSRSSSLYGRSIVNHTDDTTTAVAAAAAATTTHTTTGDIMLHLKAMIAFLRPEDTLILAVKLFSYLPDRIRYMVIVETKQPTATVQTNSEIDIISSSSSSSDDHYYCHGESVILGLDLSTLNELEETSLEDEEEEEEIRFDCKVGLVLPIYANSEIMLDGDGGFKFSSHHTTHIFKPISIQAMWSAYQYLHKAFQNARKFRFYSQSSLDNLLSLSATINNNNSPSSPTGSATSIFADNNNRQSGSAFSLTSSQLKQINQQQQHHEWVKYYSLLVANRPDQSINEWYQREERSGQRDDFTTPYFDCLKLCTEEEETGIKIREKLKEIMMRSKDDYGSMSSVYIRQLLEKELNIKLDGFKKFIDATIFQFYNQFIECATRILDHLYLGTEWNASNYDALTHDRVTHILNVSSEVDNFFLDTFKYLNVRVPDVDETDLLKEFDKTNKFIQEAREQGTCCLVHCKMGVSRSASVVLAYLMKENNWSYEQAFQFTKQKRACINPNDGFKQQLKTYESILTTKNKAINNFFDQQQQQPTSTLLIKENTSSPPVIVYDEEENQVVEEEEDRGQVDEDDELTMTTKPLDRIKSTSSVGYHPNSNNNMTTGSSQQQKSGSTCSLPGYYATSTTQIIPPTSPTVNYRKQNQQQKRDSLSAQTTPKTAGCNNNNTNISSCDSNKFSKRNTVNYDLGANEKTTADSTNTTIKTTRSSQRSHRTSGEWFSKTIQHAQSCPNQLAINDDDGSNSSSGGSSGGSKSPTVLSSPFVPAGTVKRQVLSINTNSKPIIDPATTTANNNTTTISLDDPDEKAKQQQLQLQRSPNSKRFKCEENQDEEEEDEDGVEERVVEDDVAGGAGDGNNTDTTNDDDDDNDNEKNESESAVNENDEIHESSSSSLLSPLSSSNRRLNQFYKSKRLFERLEDKSKKKESGGAVVVALSATKSSS